MRNKTVTFRFDDRDHEILNYLAKARGQNKTQVLKRMLREEEAREESFRQHNFKIKELE
jgi:predicted transcriptional regulator